MSEFEDATVRRAFDALPGPHRAALLEVRDLIFDVAASRPEVGLLTEALRWGQPSYLTEESRSGTTIRLGRFDERHAALFVHCRTTLVETYRRRFPELTFSGNRAVVVDADAPPPTDALAWCIEAALTYRLRSGIRASR